MAKELAKVYDPREVEKRTYQFWVDGNYFHATAHAKDKNGNETVYESDEECTKIPICVLINGESASASEVMSGALKDHARATLVGTKTYGKGVVQGIFDLKDGTALRITVAKYFTPSGECIDGIGIEPHIKLELPEDVAIEAYPSSVQDDPQLAKAIEVLMSDKN